mmetsp:Transcript_13781/g.20884  ORF Transcript_13781/g.20884 Transcript_13781/m.20884 type:complete len:442 (-) Transcript_13781:1143-2468(-)
MNKKHVITIIISLTLVLITLAFIFRKDNDIENIQNKLVKTEQLLEELGELVGIDTKDKTKAVKKKLSRDEILREIKKKRKKQRPYLTDPEGRTVDFVISVRFIHCSVKYSIIKINEYFNPKRIIFLSYDKDHCTILRGFATNVHCIWEQDILPYFTPARFAELVDEEVKNTNDETIITAKKDLPSHIGSFKDRSGWFFLQMINLGIARYIKDLSENYIVWDSDIIPLTASMKFWNKKGQIIRYTQKTHGELIANAYHKSYELLTGKTIIHPNGKRISGFRDEETWVAHQMVFTRKVVNRFLESIEEYRGVKRDMWTEEIVKVAMKLKNYAEFAFADYEHYASFAYDVEPEAYEVKMGSYAKFRRIYKAKSLGGYVQNTCCVPKHVIQHEQKQGMHYIVNELHKDDVPACRSLNFYGFYHRDLSISWQKKLSIESTLTTERK